MNYLFLCWGAGFGVCLLLSLNHFMIWIRNQGAAENLLFALLALSVVGMGWWEIRMMLARTPSEYAEAARWIHLPVLAATILTVAFVQKFLGGKYFALGMIVIAVRSISFALNMIAPLNLHYQSIGALKTIPFFGQMVSVPTDFVPSPTAFIAQLGLVLLVIYVGLCAANAWREGQRRRALTVGGSIVFFVFGGMGQVLFVTWGQVETPITPSVFYLPVAFAMAYELSHEVHETATLAKRLLSSEGAVLEQRRELAHLSRVSTLSELSGSLAHELSQPLATILSNAQAADRLIGGPSPDLPEIQEILRDIVSADRRATDVIQRLRSLLKREELSCCELDFHGLIDEVLALMRAEFVERGVRVERAFCSVSPVVVGDRVQLQQVFLNLFANANEAMLLQPAGRRSLLVRSTSENGTIFVTVEDSGCGLPLTDSGRIFAPFFTTKKDGLGLGLGICKTIAEAHGGRLLASGNPTGGAIFTVEMPAATHPE